MSDFKQLLDLCVVVPVYNEEEAIASVLDEWRQLLDSLSIRYRILAYNDGSKDATADILNDYAFRYPESVQACNKANEGHGPTILRGYREASQLAQWVFQMDSDNEMGSGLFPQMWAEREDYDFLLGMRDGRKQPMPRKIISFVSRCVVSIFYKKSVWDVNAPYRLMRSSSFESIYKSIPDDTFAPNLIVSGHVGREQLRFKQYAIPHQDRQTGEVSIKKWRLLKAASRSFLQTIAYSFK